jgi:hypothetical protein
MTAQPFSDSNNRGSNGDSYDHAMNVQLQSTNFHHTGLTNNTGGDPPYASPGRCGLWVRRA